MPLQYPVSVAAGGTEGSQPYDYRPVPETASAGRMYFVKQNSVKLASEIPNVGMGISAVFAGRCNGVLLNERLAA